MLYHNPLAVVQVNGKCSESFAIKQSARQGCPLSSVPVLALELLLHRFWDEEANPALRGVPFVGCHRTMVSAYADDITVFVSRLPDIEAVNKVIVMHGQIAGVKIKFVKNKGLQLGSSHLPRSFSWSDGPICILEVWFGPDLQLERN